MKLLDNQLMEMYSTYNSYLKRCKLSNIYLTKMKDKETRIKSTAQYEEIIIIKIIKKMILISY